jgi:cytochrome P450
VSESADPIEFPFAPGALTEPPPRFAQLRASTPLHRIRLWDGSTPWLVLGHAEARSLLGDARVSVSRQRHGFPFPVPSRLTSERMERSFIALDAPDHARYRKMFTKFFSIRRIESLRPFVEGLVDSLIDDLLASGPPIDLVGRLAQEVPSRVICLVLGLDPGDRGYFQSRDTQRNLLGSSGDQIETATQEILAYLDAVVTAKERAPGDDLISEVIADQLRTGNVDRAQLVAMIRHLLAAGHETTTQMIGLGTLTLLQHPDTWAELRHDPSSVPAAVEELLRYIPLFQISPNRVAAADIEIGGVEIRAGDGIVIPTSGANRDPSAFPDPDVFDIHRDATGHIAFAFGVHQCLGQSLARLELQVVFQRLTARIPTLNLAVRETELEFRDYLLLSLSALPVGWDSPSTSAAQPKESWPCE